MVTKKLLRIISVITAIVIVTLSVTLTSRASSNSTYPSNITSTDNASGYWYPVASPTNTYLQDISITPGSNGLDGWAVGYDGTFIHWDGSSWNAVAGLAGDFTAVAMVTATDGWATNYTENNQGDFYHWDGAAWSYVYGPVAFQESLAVVPGSNGQDIWSVGWWGQIFRWDGSVWNYLNSTNLLMLNGVDALTASDAWAVGGISGETEGTLLHWDGANWVNVSPPATGANSYQAVTMVASDDVWAVGNLGTIIHWDGASWLQVASPITDTLTSISMVPGSNGTAGWAVGANGAMLSWDGTAWTKIASPTTNYLLSIEMVSATDGWAVGGDGTILRYTNPQLTINYPTGAPGSFFNITGAGYPANSQATISVNNVVVGTVDVEADGSFSLTLSTAPASANGIYQVTVSLNLSAAVQSPLNTTTNPLATVQYQLDASAPLRAQEGSLPVQTVPAEIAPFHFIYLPIVIR